MNDLGDFIRSRGEEASEAIMSVIAMLRQLLRSPSCFTWRKDFHRWPIVGNHVDQVVEANELVVQNFLDVTTCIAIYVVEEVGLCVHPQDPASENLIVIAVRSI